MYVVFVFVYVILSIIVDVLQQITNEKGIQNIPICTELHIEGGQNRGSLYVYPMGEKGGTPTNLEKSSTGARRGTCKGG